MKKTYSGSSVEECLNAAAAELKMDINEIEYEVRTQKKGFFKKVYEVEVMVPERENFDGSVSVVNGTIEVLDPKTDGRKATIAPTKEIRLFLDGDEVKSKTVVDSGSDITWEGIQEEGSRELNIHVNEDRTKAFIDIELKAGREYKIKDSVGMTDLIVGSEKAKEIPVPTYTPEEIVLNLKKLKIVSGIIVDNINGASGEESVKGILVAEGKAAIEGTDDKLILNYNENKVPFKDAQGNVDFKSIGHVDTIQAGECVCELTKGEEEKDGIDVYGKIIKAEKCKRITINAGKGCTLEGNKIIAQLSGKAVRKAYTFMIEPVYVINGDVDLTTGDVKFDGTVEIYGEVTEGMKVESGSSIVIHQGVSGAEIKSQNDITIDGNIMTSNVASGGEEVFQKKVHNCLVEVHSIIEELDKMARQVYETKILGENVKIGEVFKVLIERRYKKLNTAIEEYRNLITIKYGGENNLAKILREKLTGFGPLSIGKFEEIDILKTATEHGINSVKTDGEKKSDVVLSYIQDSKVMCHGDVFINGKGEYVSEIISNGSIYFGENSVARGGYLKAYSEIKCNVVGSNGKVRTTLHVEKDGKISIEKAHSNTKLIVGKVEYVIDEDCRSVLAYLDERGEMTVEKLKD